MQPEWPFGQLELAQLTDLTDLTDLTLADLTDLTSPVIGLWRGTKGGDPRCEWLTIWCEQCHLGVSGGRLLSFYSS